jgi:hypothetical protein
MDREHLNGDQLLNSILEAFSQQKPLSIARIGDGENIVLAQYSLMPEMEFMKTSVGRKWPKHGSGIKLPDCMARDEILNALKKIDIIGVLPYNDKKIKANEIYKRSLTDKIFDYYQLYPKKTFDALLFREMLACQEFWDIMQGKEIIIVSKWGGKFRNQFKLIQSLWNIRIADVLPIENYNGIHSVLQQTETIKFDAALICAGVGSIILSHQISERYGKVAIDVGKGLTRIAKGKVQIPLRQTTDEVKDPNLQDNDLQQ